MIKFALLRCVMITLMVSKRKYTELSFFFPTIYPLAWRRGVHVVNRDNFRDTWVAKFSYEMVGEERRGATIPYRYVFCWRFLSQCQLSNAGKMRAEFLALDFGLLRHLAARIRIMNEIIEISQPAPSSCQERIMNGPIGAVHSDKEYLTRVKI